MANVSREVARRLTKRLQQFTTRSSVRAREKWLAPFPVGIRFDALLTLQGGRWDRLDRNSRLYRDTAQQDLIAIRRQQGQWAGIWNDTERLRTAARSSWISHRERPDWDTIRPRLVSDAVGAGLSQAEAERRAEAFGRAGVDDLLAPMELLLEQGSSELQSAAMSRLFALAAADLGTAVAQFNVLAERGGQRQAPVRARVVQVQLEKQLRGLQTVLRRGSPATIRAEARRTEASVSRVMPGLLEHAVAAALADAKRPSVTAGRRAVKAADVLRLALFTLSAARLVRWTAGWPEGSPHLETWRKAAREKAYRTQFRPPPLVRVDDVLRRPAHYRGRYIRVEGRVGPVSITHRGGTVRSSSSLRSASAETLPVALKHIKLDSGGLVAGCYAELVGTFGADQNGAGLSAFTPDRRNLTEDSRASWLDWLSLELLPVSTPIAHMLCGRWSWMRGRDGAGNPLRYGTWASPQARRLS